MTPFESKLNVIVPAIRNLSKRVPLLVSLFISRMAFYVHLATSAIGNLYSDDGVLRDKNGDRVEYRSWLRLGHQKASCKALMKLAIRLAAQRFHTHHARRNSRCKYRL